MLQRAKKLKYCLSAGLSIVTLFNVGFGFSQNSFPERDNDGAQNNLLRFEYLTVKDGLLQNNVHGIAKDKYGFMWFGSWNGLCRYDGYKFKSYRTDVDNPRSVSSNRIHSIYKDAAGTLWVSSFDSIICRYNDATDDFTRFRRSELPQSLLDSTDRRNPFFFAARYHDAGWSIRDNKLWQTTKGNPRELCYSSSLFSTTSLNDDYLNCLYKDDCDILWIGTSKGGVNKADLRAKQFSYTYNTIPDGKSWFNATVRSLYVDKNVIWIGNNTKGISVVDRRTGNVKRFTKTTAVATGSDYVRAVYKDHLGDFWIGYRGGFDRYITAQGRIRHYIGDEAKGYLPWNKTHFAITEDKTQTLWVGSYDGVYSYDRVADKFRFHNLLPYSRHSFVMCILADSHNNLWIGTEQGGLIHIKQGPGHLQWTDTVCYVHTADNKSPITDNRIYSLLEDAHGNIWIGTADGLCRLDTKTGAMEKFTVQNGLADQYISKILADKMGNLWVSHKKGLSKINIDTKAIKNYTISDGSHGYEFVDGSGFCEPNTGEMFFGGTEGYVSFFPNQIVDNPIPPKIVFTDLLVLNKPVAVNQPVNGKVILQKPITLTRAIELAYADRDFTIEFAALHFSDPENNKYAHMLAGYDKDWIYTDASNRTATYTNLKPGTYTFRVKASNCDGVWNPEPAVLAVTILPPWWRAWWVIALCMLVCVLLVYIVYRIIVLREKYTAQIRFEQMKAGEMENLYRQKMDFFTYVSHEFRTPLTLILDPLDKIASRDVDDVQYAKYWGFINRNARHLLDLINQLLDFRKAESGLMALEAEPLDIVGFVKGIAEMFRITAAERDIRYSVNAAIARQDVWFDRDKVGKIVSNLLSNAFKYTHNGGQISVDVTVGAQVDDGSPLGRYVEIKVQDTGIGIPARSIDKVFDAFYEAAPSENTTGTGIGLSLVKQLVLLHQGHIRVDSVEDQGSCFTVRLPLGDDHLLSSQRKQSRPSSSIVGDDELSIPTETTDEAETETGKPTVLVVDDNDDILKYLNLALRPFYTVVQAVDGKAGLETALVTLPDLVISDVSMPVMDGMELCRILKSDVRTSHIPIVLLTALIADSKMVEGYETGADAYVTKPFSTSVLLAQVKGLIELRQKIRELFGNGTKAELKKVATNAVDEQFMNKVVAVVERNMSNFDLSPDLLASELNISRSLLFKKIKALTNQTVNDFIMAIRLNSAAELLQSGKYKIVDVAFKTGFSEHSHFTRRFTKQFGQTPSDYGKTHRNEN